MSVLRQLNILGQMRLDVPHVRSVESSICADFDVFAGKTYAGQQALVIRGFTLANYAGGTAATSIQLATADSILFNVNASTSGTFLWIPANRAVEVLNPATNPNVVGSFTASQTNYIGLDIIRSADATTSDLVQFLDPDSLLESPKNIPLGLTTNYQIVISTTPFSAQPNLVPIAKVVTDSQNNVSNSSPVVDARNLMFRLGAGGDFPNALSSYNWPQGRLEVDSGATAFQGGDKGIPSQKDWNAAIMSRLWEIGGGENWYSPTADRNVKMNRVAAAVFSDGDNFEYVSNNLHWQGLRILFDNSNESGVYYNIIADQLTSNPGQTDINTPGQCLYVDLIRSSNATLTAVKGNLQTLGTPVTPGSRFVFAWVNTDGTITVRDTPLPVGSTFQPATTTSLGAVELLQVSGTPSTPKVFNPDANTSLTYTASGGNATALTITGNGSGNGLTATGGATGNGVSGTGGSTSGNGGVFTGTGSGISGGSGVTGTGAGIGNGVFGLGGNSIAGGDPSGAGVLGEGSIPGATGVVGTGGSGGNSIGVHGFSFGTSAGVQGDASGASGVGVLGNGGSSSGIGVKGLGGGTGAGVAGTGGGTSGTGVTGTGGATNGVGVAGTGTGSGYGVTGTGGTTGAGGQFSGNANRGSVNLVPLATPASPSNGDIWVDTSDNWAKAQVNGSTYRFAGQNPAINYVGTTGSTFASGSIVVVNFPTSVLDTLSDVTNAGSNWTYTVRTGRGGVHLISVILSFVGGITWASSDFVQLYLYVNGSQVDSMSMSPDVGTTNYPVISYTVIRNLNAGDTVQIKATYQHTGSGSGYTGGGTEISIARLN